mgnify:FL=1
MIRQLSLLSAIVLGSMTTPALGQQASPWQLSGFGTLGMVATSQSDIRFARIGVDRPGSETPDFGPDTVLGIQANISLSPQTSAVLQLVSRERPANGYLPHPSLAFVSYTPSPDLSIRLGRLRVPFFMHSDSLDINYALPWIQIGRAYV